MVVVDPDGHGPAPVVAYHGTWVFDSLFNINAFKPDHGSTLYLQQHFKGWYIETPDDRFDVDAATIFDFRTPRPAKCASSTCCRPRPGRRWSSTSGCTWSISTCLLDAYIRNVLGVGDYTSCERRDRHHAHDRLSVSPPAGPARDGGRHSGRTGQSDDRLRLHAHPGRQRGDRRLADGMRPPVRRSGINRPGYRLLDSVMLQVMRRNPECLKPTFEAMFPATPARASSVFWMSAPRQARSCAWSRRSRSCPFVLGAAQLLVSRTRGLSQEIAAPAADPIRTSARCG